MVGQLKDWGDLAQDREWPSLLMGNGSSLAVWEKFSYLSLLDVAKATIPHPLDQGAAAIFTAMGTSHFERVLAHLDAARIVNASLGLPVQPIIAAAAEVRRGLRESVAAVHVPAARLEDADRRGIADAMSKHDHVYSTNYDLIAYWALMADRESFTDLFSPDPELEILLFDRHSAGRRANRTKVLYLHGALHLNRLPDGSTTKLIAPADRNLLDTLVDAAQGDFWNAPLLVTEGTSAAKLSSIRGSDYLDYAFETLRDDRSNLVVFGQALAEQDQHIVDAISGAGERYVAYGVHMTEGTNIVAEMKRIEAQLPVARVEFFDSSTHPLGAPTLLKRP